MYSASRMAGKTLIFQVFTRDQEKPVAASDEAFRFSEQPPENWSEEAGHWPL
jgi:hypothetical protein